MNVRERLEKDREVFADTPMGRNLDAFAAEYDDLRARLTAAEAELAEWHAECDKVGVPYDPPGLVRHHRGNAGLAAALNADTDARIRLREAEELLRESLPQTRKARSPAAVDDAVRAFLARSAP